METKTPLFDKFVKAAKVLDFKMSDFAKAKKILTPEFLEYAVFDGVTLRSQEDDDDFDGVTYAATVGASRTRSKVVDMVEDLETLTMRLGSAGCRLLKERLEACPATGVDDLKEQVARYAKLVQSTCADVHLYRNALDNHHARKDYTDDQLACARAMCKDLNLTVNEGPAKKICGR